MLVKIDRKRVDLSQSVLVQVGDRFAIIDKEDADRVCGYKWHLKQRRFQFYAVRKKRRNGKEFLIYMHRQITHCPNNRVVHHKNHNGLDNRKQNLEKMTAQAHADFHRFGL